MHSSCASNCVPVWASTAAASGLLALSLVTAGAALARAADPPAGSGAATAQEQQPGHSGASSSATWEERLVAIREWRDAKRAAGEAPTREETAAFVRKTMTGADFTSVTLEQLQAAWPNLAIDEGVRREAVGRLQSLAASTGADGAAAACFLAMAGADDEASASRLAKAALDHPGLAEHLAQSGPRATAQTAGLLEAIDKSELGPYAERALEWARKFQPETPPRDLRAAVGYLTALRQAKEVIGAERFEEVRSRIAASVQSAAAKAKEAGNADEAMALEKLAARLNSAAMKGLLLGHPAPALTFEWVHDRDGTPSWKSLAELKGKVVVLDFWATWCGPCVASFPAVRELREHYSSDDVVILGVTSLQGAHYWRKNEDKPDRPSKVETKEDPSLERSLMTEYMDEMNITWPVVFTAEDVFNADYDVNGIPHVAIIDAQGVLRYNGLHPAVPLREKTDKIDALLKEAGRTPPSAPAKRTEDNR